MPQILIYAIVISSGVLVGWVLSIRKDRRKHFNRIDILPLEVFKKLMRKGQLIDIRNQERFNKNHIKGARNFQPRFLKNKRQTKIRRDQAVFMYCHNGKKSLSVAKKLIPKFNKINILDGGYKAYEKSKDE